MKKSFDPRVRLLLVTLVTTLAMVMQEPLQLLAVTLVTLISAWMFKVDILPLAYRMRRFLYILFALALVQSLFRQGGTALVTFGQWIVVSDQGIRLAIGYLCRVIIILCSGALVAASGLRRNLQALKQIGVPYELALMTGVGIRFLPMLTEELRNTMTAMALRGIDVGSLPIKQRFNLVSRLFIPMVRNTLTRARKLSESIEARGFVIGEKRSNYDPLVLDWRDILIMMAMLLLFGMVVWRYLL